MEVVPSSENFIPSGEKSLEDLNICHSTWKVWKLFIPSNREQLVYSTGKSAPNSELSHMVGIKVVHIQNT